MLLLRNSSLASLTKQGNIVQQLPVLVVAALLIASCSSRWLANGFVVVGVPPVRFLLPLQQRPSSLERRGLAVQPREEEDEIRIDYDNYWEEEEDRIAGDASDGPLKGAYNVYFEGSPYSQEDIHVDWELADDGSTWVCLPPAYITRPTAVLHFVGGTFFGSSPKLWYKTLLEGVVQSTHCAVVVTPIPVTLFKNPLQHVKLSRKLQQQFQMAYVDILHDEYGSTIMEDVPTVGMGHSLGARLMTVLATLSQPNKKNSDVPPYSSYILMSFTNYGASASIPGVRSLLQERRKLDRTGTRKRSYDEEKRWRDRREDYDDDDDWEELFEEFQDTLSDVKDALTPRSEDLEFIPAPDQLWKALLDDKRYKIPKTLLVQFDEDDVDQSPRLAECLVKTNSSDIKYARLHGNHLTPINADGTDEKGGGWLQLPTRASKAVWKLIRGTGKSNKQDAETMRDLRQSISRYIMDVVTVKEVVA